MDGSRRISFAILITGSLLASLDLFIVNVAFGAIGSTFPQATPQTLEWVLVIYSVAFAALLIPAGGIADQIGRRRTFVTGMAIFVLGSVACGLASDLTILIVGRGIQGIGAAAMIPTSLGLLLATYPPERHKRVVSVWAASGSVAAALGPVLGGLLVQIDWRWIFLINIVIALPALLFSRRLTGPPGAGGRLPDIAGSVLLAMATASVVVFLSNVAVEAGQLVAMSALAAAVLFVAALIWRSRTARTPAIKLELFHHRSFSVATAAMVAFYSGFGVMLVGAPLALIRAVGLAPPLAGIAFALGPTTAVVASIAAGRLRLTPRSLTIVGGIVFAASGAWWATLFTSADAAASGFIPGVVLGGVAAGIVQTALIAGGTQDLSPADFSAGTGAINTGRQIGAAIGVALFVASTAHADLGRLDSFTWSWTTIAASGVLVVIAGLLLPRAQTAAKLPGSVTELLPERRGRRRPPLPSDTTEQDER